MNKKKVVAIVIARMGSTRLPGKVLMDLGKKRVLDWIFDAFLWSDLTDEFWVATTTESRDDEIVRWADSQGIPVFRGSTNDVLDRVYHCALEAKATHVIRVTGDCPFQDPTVWDQLVALQQKTGADYVSNVNPATWPDGLDCEVISMDALECAHRSAMRPSDRDTVTQFIARNRYRFASETLVCPIPGLNKERWVLDTPEDYDFCKDLVHALGDLPPRYPNILSVLEENPSIRQLNSMHPRNERFFDALAEEQDIAERKYKTSQALLKSALKTTPYGAGTYSKSHVAFGTDNGPLYLTHGEGGHVFDADGNRYIDLVGSVASVILGHCDPDVDAAVRHQQSSGSSFSLGTPIEIELAQTLKGFIPCAEKVFLCKGGSDACTIAVRLAAAVTGHDAPVLFHGAYHGWHDWAIAGTERGHAVTANQYRVLPSSTPGGHGWPIKASCVIVEPEMHSPEYLRQLRSYCHAEKIPLIFDEVLTGFRYPGGSFQAYTGIIPDIACFAKSIANGYALGAVVGHALYLDRIAPGSEPNCFVSGTFFGETTAISAGIACVEKIFREDVPAKIRRDAMELHDGVWAIAQAHGMDEVLSLGGPPFNRHSWKDPTFFAPSFRKHMADAGVLIYGTHNLMYAHTQADIRRVLSAYDYAFERIRAGDTGYTVPRNVIMRR